MAYAGGGAAAAELGPELVVVHATFPFSSLSPPPTPSPEHVPSSRYETACKNSSCINSIVETLSFFLLLIKIISFHIIFFFSKLQLGIGWQNCTLYRLPTLDQNCCRLRKKHPCIKQHQTNLVILMTWCLKTTSRSIQILMISFCSTSPQRHRNQHHDTGRSPWLHFSVCPWRYFNISIYLYTYTSGVYIPLEYIYTCRYIKFGFGFWDSSLSHVLFNLQNYLPIP